MTGRPIARTSGQYDGEGRCTPVPSPGWATSAPVATRTTLPSSFSWYLRCQNSSRCDTVGTVSKLWAGTGDCTIHSRLRASHGSGPGSTGLVRCLRQLASTFQAKISIDTAMMNTPTVDTMFQKSNP